MEQGKNNNKKDKQTEKGIGYYSKAFYRKHTVLAQIMIAVSVIAYITFTVILAFYMDGMEGDSLESAVKKQDFTRAHEVLDEYYEDYVHTLSSPEAEEEDIQRESDQYWTAAKLVYKDEMSFLMEQDDIEAYKRLLRSFTMINPIGEKPYDGQTVVIDKCGPYDLYQQYCNHYNQLCDVIFDLAYINKNKYVAEQVIMLYKEDINRTDKEGGWFKDDTASYQVAWASKGKSQKKLEDAIANGSFPQK